MKKELISFSGQIIDFIIDLDADNKIFFLYPEKKWKCKDPVIYCQEYVLSEIEEKHIEEVFNSLDKKSFSPIHFRKSLCGFILLGIIKDGVVLKRRKISN